MVIAKIDMIFSVDSNGNPVAISEAEYNGRLEGMRVCLNTINFWRSRAALCPESCGVVTLEQISEIFYKVILSSNLDAVISSLQFPQSQIFEQISQHLCIAPIFCISQENSQNQLSLTHICTLTIWFHYWIDGFTGNACLGNEENCITLHTISATTQTSFLNEI